MSLYVICTGVRLQLLVWNVSSQIYMKQTVYDHTLVCIYTVKNSKYDQYTTIVQLT